MVQPVSCPLKMLICSAEDDANLGLDRALHPGWQRHKRPIIEWFMRAAVAEFASFGCNVKRTAQIHRGEVENPLGPLTVKVILTLAIGAERPSVALIA